MSRETMSRIFEPYFTTKAEGEGTGLGLSVIHGIVQSHGGAITVYSEPGEGSEFHIYLPLIEESAGERQRSVPKSLPTGNERILFVDDELALADLGKLMLAKLGYSVVAETDSERALDLFRSDPEAFDAVVTDLTMPKLRGDNLAKELLQIRPDLPIIIATGFGNSAIRQGVMEVGVKILVGKPLSIEELAQNVRMALDGALAGC